MSRAGKVGWRLLAVLLATLVFSPIVGWLLPETPFHRVMTRFAQIGVVLVFVVGAGKPTNWRSKTFAVGLRGPDRFRRCFTGVVVALAFLVALLAVSYVLDGRGPAVREPKKTLAYHLLIALTSATIVATFEELLFRGLLNNVIGGLASAFCYAAIHYFRPLKTSAGAGETFDPLLGFKTFPTFFEAWTDIRIFGIVALFIFGLALNRMRARTGTLYLGIGVHGGLVLGLALYRRWINGKATGERWIWGGGRVYDGLAPAVALLALWALVHFVPLPRWMTRNGVKHPAPPAAE